MLYIFQYPLKPNRDGYDNSTFAKTCIKPENQEVVIDVEIDTQDSHYNVNRGETIAANAEIPAKRDQDEDDKFFNRCSYFLQLYFLFVEVYLDYKLITREILQQHDGQNNTEVVQSPAQL